MSDRIRIQKEPAGIALLVWFAAACGRPDPQARRWGTAALAAVIGGAAALMANRLL